MAQATTTLALPAHTRRPKGRPHILPEWIASDASDLFDVFFGMSVNGTVVPGQPLPVTFWFWTYNGTLDFGTGWSLKVFYVDKPKTDARGTVIYELPSDGSFSKFQFKWPNQPIHPRYDMHTRDETIDLSDSFPPGTALADSLYHIGQHTLRVEFTTSGADAGPYVTTATLEVVPEPAIGLWWTWDSTAPFAANWNDDYQLSGRLQDGSAYVALDFTLELVEDDENNSERSVTTLTPSVFPSNSLLLTFPAITQDWKWLIPVVWAVETTDLGKAFNYAVKVSGQDLYGNFYTASRSSSHAVEVNVSDKKVGLAFNAFQAQESAIGLGIAAAATTAFPLLSALLGVAAAAAQTAAAIFGSLALDPPKPNTRYLRAVRLRPVRSIAERFAAQPGAAIVRYLYLLTYGCECLVALYETESRILGARRDRSTQGLAIQLASRRKILTEMARLSQSLPNDAAAAAAAFRRRYAVHLTTALRGSRAATQRRIKSAALPSSLKRSVKVWLEDKAAVKRLARKGALPLLFRGMAKRFSLILKGYVDELNTSR